MLDTMATRPSRPLQPNPARIEISTSMAATIFFTNPDPSPFSFQRLNLSPFHIKPTKHFHLLSPLPLQTLTPLHLHPLNSRTIPFASTNSRPNGFFKISEPDNPFVNSPLEEEKDTPVKTLLWVLFWASASLAFFAFSKDAEAAGAVAAGAGGDSIRASRVGVKVAGALRGLGWRDEAVVVALATLPVIELRGAIPVGYWMHLNPILLTVLSVLGNMLPVPFIILYLKKLATFLAGKNKSAARLLNMLFERAKEKAGPVEEFQWLGLMLFVAVPFPGTGAWSGAIIASLLDMPFWSGLSANFFGVVMAGLIVNLLMNLGLNLCHESNKEQLKRKCRFDGIYQHSRTACCNLDIEL
ncbi:hypothetical protein AKJ16_DCAP04148 [Drosera capensis]